MQTVFTYIGYYFVVRLLHPYIRTVLNIIWNYVTRWASGRPASKWTEKYGSWAVVTGSTDGIGKAYANELAQRGMNIVLISRSQEKLDRVATEIQETFKVQTKTVQIDFGHGPAVFDRIESELENLEVGVLVNNVGIINEYPIAVHETSATLALRHIHVNVTSAVLMTRMILPQMRARNRGAIVNVSSVVDAAPWPFFSLYSASKAFVKNFTLALRNENMGTGITIQLVSPSIVKTKLANYSPTCQQLPDFLIPRPETFVRSAIKTLGNSYHTAGYVTHEIHLLLQEIPNIYVLTFILGILSRFFRKQHDLLVEQKKNLSK